MAAEGVLAFGVVIFFVLCIWWVAPTVVYLALFSIALSAFLLIVVPTFIDGVKRARRRNMD